MTFRSRSLTLFTLLLAGCWKSFSADVAPGDAGTPPPPPPMDLGMRDMTTPDLGMVDLGDVDFGTPDECTHGWRMGEPCARDFDCDDRCLCNGLERCIANRCMPATVAACPPSVPCATATCDDVRGCGWHLDPSVCDDHEFCNGPELCVPEFGCRPGLTPLCDDASDCTYDTCPIGVGCVHTLRDDDHDGHVVARCGGDDCNDDPITGGPVHPGAIEICGDNADGDCSDDWDYDLPMCSMSVNDTCATAPLLDAPGYYEGTTVGEVDDYAVSCGPGGADVVYRLRLDRTRLVTLTVFFVGVHVPSDTMPESLTVRPWTGCASGPDTRCAAGPVSSAAGPHPSASMPIFLDAGDYAVILEAQTPSSYTFRVEW